MKALLDPVAWVWFGSLAWAVFLFFQRKRRAAFVLAGLFCAVGLVQGLDLHARLLSRLERPYLSAAVLETKVADAVVVLGGNLRPFPPSSLGMELSDSIDRVFTGIALVRAGRGHALILGGGGIGTAEPSEAQTAKNWIASWQLVSVPVMSLGICANTHEEAVHTAELARSNGFKRIILVSSAWHLRRATATFRKAGLNVVPVGCDFRGSSGLQGPRSLSVIPRTDSLVLFNLWLTESVGYVYYWIRSWV